MFKNLIKSSALAVAALALMTSAAFASDGTTAVVTPGSFGIVADPTVSDFDEAFITGIAQTTDADLDAFSVSDLTGSGAGWTVTAQAAQFTGADGHDLATGSLKMSQPSVLSPGTTSPDPSIETGPYTLDGAQAALVATADVDEGMGTYNFSATTLTLSLPALVYADSYASTVTITAAQTP